MGTRPPGVGGPEHRQVCVTAVRKCGSWRAYQKRSWVLQLCLCC
ncbi:hypothetical protein LINPERHAP1_LOCUS14100 [Linum perenne]